MTTTVEAPDACLAWLDSFQALPLAERQWVVDFITDQSPDEIGADVAARPATPEPVETYLPEQRQRPDALNHAIRAALPVLSPSD
jgi:hypothetical protein